MLKTRQAFMKSQINILFISLYLLLFAFTTFGQNGKPINSGVVFIDGKYVEPPYIITSVAIDKSEKTYAYPIYNFNFEPKLFRKQ